VLATAFVQEGIGSPEAGGQAKTDPDSLDDEGEVPPRVAEESSATTHEAVAWDIGAVRRLFTWRNALAAVAAAFALLGVGTTGYVTSRTLGIGPAATLVSRGVITEREVVVLADFENLTPDSLLGDDVTQLLRIDLLQSPTIAVAEPDQIAEVLHRMERARSTPLDYTLAREVAIREGFKAVLGGEVRSLGGGYVITAQLVAALDGETLLAVRETAGDSAALIPTVERLSRRVRERIGESLRSIRGGEPLASVSTASLDALRRYTQGVRAVERDGDWVRAAELYEEAIALDTTFAMAYRRLGVEGRIGRARSVEALTKAYEYRDRLVERERFQVEGSYHADLTGDLDAAIRAYRNLLETWPDDARSLNDLAVLLARQGDRATAIELLRRAIEIAPSIDNYLSLSIYQLDLGRTEDAWATTDEAIARFPENVLARGWRAGGFTTLGDYERADSVVRALIEEFPDNVNARVGSLRFQTWVDGVRGRLAEAEAHGQAFEDIAGRLGLWGQLYGDAIRLAEISIWSRREPERGIREVERVLTRYPPSQRDPLDRPGLELARFLARAGHPQRAEALVDEYETRVPPELRGANRWELPLTRGVVAVAQGRLSEAVAEFRIAEKYPLEACLLCPISELALVYDRAGEADSAIAYFERYLNTPWAQRIFEDPFKRPHTLERLGQLYDDRGDLENAAKYYAMFVELWNDADPELQPRVQEAQRRLQEIRSNR
jgi:tetratricopeptide (TPR) repeat protein